MPEVLPPSACKLAAVSSAPSASLTLIVIASAEPVVRAPRLLSESAARVAVTTPFVAAAILFN